MISVTRLNGSELYLNPDLIISLEETPDTVLTLTNGEKLIIKERISEVVSRYIDYKRAVNSLLDAKAP